MFGSWVIVIAIAVVVVGLVASALLGGRNADTRTTTALVSGMRSATLGLIIIGTELHGAAHYMGPAITFALMSLIIPMLVAVEIGRKADRGRSRAPSRARADGGDRGRHSAPPDRSYSRFWNLLMVGTALRAQRTTGTCGGVRFAA